MPLKEITPAELLERFPDEQIRRQLYTTWNVHYPDATAVVLFENVMLDSSQLGTATACPVGPSNTFKTVEAAEGKWINGPGDTAGLPSQRRHATSYCVPPRPWGPQ